ncbi:integrin-linked protein kinase 1-like protein [Tanacetum coccineum]
MSGSEGSSGHSTAEEPQPPIKKKDKTKVSRTSLILWHSHQNDPTAVKKLLDEDESLVNARDYDNRTPLHVASLHGWIDVAKVLIESGADVNALDRWKNTEGFDRWDLDFEAWKFCFLPGQIASCLVIFFLSCSLFVAIYLDIDSKIMMIVVCL